MEEANGIKYLITADNDLQARMMEATLKDAGIPHMRRYGDTSHYFKTLFGDSAHRLTIDIFVPESAYEEAMELMVYQRPMHSND